MISLLYISLKVIFGMKNYNIKVTDNDENLIWWGFVLVYDALVHKAITNDHKKAWEALNVYFNSKLWFKQKLYYFRPGLITRETKMRVKFVTQQLLAWNLS